MSEKIELCPFCEREDMSDVGEDHFDISCPNSPDADITPALCALIEKGRKYDEAVRLLRQIEIRCETMEDAKAVGAFLARDDIKKIGGGE